MAWREDAKITKLRTESLYIGSGSGTLISRTAAQINLLIQGVAAGYKVARGSLTATATASFSTGLTTVVHAVVTARAASAANINKAVAVSWDKGVVAGYMKVYRWKHKGVGSPTLIAATSNGILDWVAIGT